MLRLLSCVTLELRWECLEAFRVVGGPRGFRARVAGLFLQYLGGHTHPILSRRRVRGAGRALLVTFTTSPSPAAKNREPKA